MDGGSKRQTVAAIKVCFDAISARALCRVEMDTHENCIAIRIGDSHSRPQGDKDIILAGHDYAIAGRCEHLFKALRDLERHLLFRDPLSRNAAAIETAVAGIDYDSRGRIGRCPSGSGAQQTGHR